MILPPLTFLFMEGDPGDKMYIIRSGKVRIMKREGSHMATLAELGPGSILGEMSLLDQQPRSATAKTLENTEVVVIDQEMLAKTYASIPAWLTSIIRMVVQRLRETTARKYQDDICNALPGLLFILTAQNKGKLSSPHSIPHISDALKSIYGLSHNDVYKMLTGLGGLGLVQLHNDAKGLECLDIPNPSLLALCYRYLLNLASPKPSAEFTLEPKEAQVLEAILLASEHHPHLEASLTVITVPQLLEALEQTHRELIDEPRHLFNLTLAQHIQITPLLQKNQEITKSHRISFLAKEIRDFVAMHALIPSLTDKFTETVKSH